MDNILYGCNLLLLLHQLMPNIVITFPMTDLCWTRQQLHREIASSVTCQNLKSSKAEKVAGGALSLPTDGRVIPFSL
jgi:hypothetical protein